MHQRIITEMKFYFFHFHASNNLTIEVEVGDPLKEENRVISLEIEINQLNFIFVMIR